MIRLIIGIALLLTSCTSLKKPSCAGVPYCEQIPKYYSGIPARLTVQRAIQQMLIGGKPVDGADWPASVYAKSAVGACSATLVGERVVLLAAHCVEDGKQISFAAHANNYTATCSQHPQYKSNQTADFALCLTDRPVTGISFEEVGIDESLTIGQTVLLSGYGCVNPGGGGGNDGIFRTGNAQVIALPGTSSNDTITQGGAAVCFGDSGGPAWIERSDNSRVIFGINSRGDISKFSYLASVYNGTLFSAWAKSWAKANANSKICGVHSDAAYCRNNGSAPPDELKFEIAGSGMCIKGVISPWLLNKKDEVISKMQQTIDSF